ncbi:MAG: C10 family peptidase, partial [Muribaculaceae bacterium]|nr:C10 family peptidase [Muribaculaceae bacterium]
MRTIKSVIILVLGALALTATTQAAPLSQQQARNRAMAFMTQKHGSMAGRTLTRTSWRAQAVDEANDQVLAFNVQGGGYVIVANDERIDDVLAYSLTGTIDSNRMPPAMQDMLTSYAEQIAYMQEHNLAPHRAPTHPAVQPLIQTKWGQDWPYNYEINQNFNQNCPTGCVATSMSQVMYYHKWPQDSTARYITPATVIIKPTVFDWDNMLLTYSDNGEYPESQVKSVAHLMETAGESVDMKYKADGSGTQSYLIKPALIGCFKYDKGIRYIMRDDYTIDKWDELMYKELANNRPIIYNAMTSWGSGHSFVCHGYDGNGKYYINWGWDGDCDGYFALSILDSQGTGTGGGGKNNRWTVHQDAVIGIQPPVEGSTEQFPGFVQVAQHLLLSEPEITRDANGKYPPIHLQTIYYAVYDSEGLAIALLDGNDQFIRLLPKSEGKHLNTIANDYKCYDCKLSIPSDIADGTYHLVTCYGHKSDSTKIFSCGSYKNIFVEMVVNNGNITLKPYPVKALELTNPQTTVDAGKIASITFDVKNNGDEFNGNLFLLSNNHLKASECVAIPAGETQQVEFRVKSDNQFDATEPYRVYTDPMLMHRVYGEGEETDALFETYDVSRTNIDMENMKVSSHIISGFISSVNVGTALFNCSMVISVVNPDNEFEIYGNYVTPNDLNVAIGDTATMRVLVLIPANVSRARIKLGYNDRLVNTVY